jgi:hypothetical protein
VNRIHRLARAALVAWGCMLLGGCLTVEFGHPVAYRALDGMVPGETTHAEILLALGEPRGAGAFRVAQYERPRDALYYEYIKASGSRTQVEILIVLMQDQRFDGYMWFGSSARVKREGGVPGLVPPEQLKAGRFPSPRPLESQFVRGLTDRGEILATLGPPTGFGGAMLPPDHRPLDILYYESLKAGEMRYVADEMLMQIEQRMLVVMLDGNVFSGFMWTDNTGTAEGRTNP